MDAARLAILRSVELRLTEQSGRHLHLLVDPQGGGTLALSPEVARDYAQVRRRLDGGAAPLERDALESAAALASYVERMRRAATVDAKPVNPLMINLPLFQVAPYQPALAPLARVVVSWAGAAVLLLLAALCIWTGASTDWALASRIEDVLSPASLLAFAALAPLLKLLHEMGHVLIATRFGARVRRAGMFLVGFYPLPYVDLSEADVTATRGERIAISLGGLLADVTIGLIAFLLWHVADDAWTREFFKNVFLFNTVNTLMFNLNPLMRLDGYFALSDALHKRNFYMESAMALGALRKGVARLAFGEIRRLFVERPGRLLYGAAALIFKLYILAVIVWAVAPEYLGLGLAAALWGAGLLLMAPMVGRPPATPQEDGGSAAPPEGRGRRRWIWAGIAAAAVAAAFIPAPPSLTTPLRVDLAGAYTLRAAVGGRVETTRGAGPVAAGEELARLVDPEIEAAQAFARRELALYETLLAATQGVDPLAAGAASERLEAARMELARLEIEAARLSIRAEADGWFRPRDDLTPGARIEAGSPVGVLLPTAQTAQLIGGFPESYVERFGDRLIGAELRHDDGDRQGYLTRQDGLTLALVRPESRGAEDERRFEMTVAAPVAPRALAGRELHLRLRFEAEPIWSHVRFWFAQLTLEFRRAQELARRRALEE